ncbi:hypothetical protein DNI12_23790 [Salmonella enterica subsp. enterica]|nr:hypothetical protein [Salmonella enterica subsp. enterica serovar Senftenberg]
MKKINHWINGKNVAGNDYFQTTNPATGDVLAEVASGGEAEVNQAVAAAKEAFPKWANLPMKERARLMRRLGDLIDQNVPEIAAMETADTGLPIHQTKNVLIPRASHNFEFFAEVCQQMNGKTYPVDDKMLNYTLVQPVGVCALISQQHWEKVSGYIRLGIEEGATLLAGGAEKPTDLPAHLKGGNFLRPTVLADVDNRMRVAQEEIFGPVACLLPFKDEAEGLRLANDVEYGLASYIWTQDVSKVLRLARGIEAGMVFVNTQNVRDLRQPFGGVKASGTGREGGEYSFEVFAEMKNVCISMGDHPIPKWGV